MVGRYHIPAVAVACSEYPGEIPEANHMETIRNGRKTGGADSNITCIVLYLHMCL